MAVRFCANCGAPVDPSGTCERCDTTAAAALQPGTPTYSQTTYGATPQAQMPPPPSISRFSGQWNWGAFLLCPFWLMNHGNLGLGILYLVLSFIPFLNLGALGMGIYFGIKGNDVAVRKRAFVDEAQFVAVQNAWRNWGFVVFGISIVLGLAFGVLAGIMGAMGHAMH